MPYGRKLIFGQSGDLEHVEGKGRSVLMTRRLCTELREEEPRPVVI